jgi:hypothetical protein
VALNTVKARRGNGSLSCATAFITAASISGGRARGRVRSSRVLLRKRLDRSFQESRGGRLTSVQHAHQGRGYTTLLDATLTHHCFLSRTHSSSDQTHAGLIHLDKFRASQPRASHHKHLQTIQSQIRAPMVTVRHHPKSSLDAVPTTGQKRPAIGVLAAQNHG